MTASSPCVPPLVCARAGSVPGKSVRAIKEAQEIARRKAKMVTGLRRMGILLQKNSHTETAYEGHASVKERLALLHGFYPVMEWELTILSPDLTTPVLEREKLGSLALMFT
jgi:hypothetical protein